MAVASPPNRGAIAPLAAHSGSPGRAIFEAIAQGEQPTLTGSEITCASLVAEGVTTVFGYPGGAVIPLYDALPRFDLHHVLVRFEQWAALAADGYARATGKVGVCIATSGPGATNLVTGLANSQLDSVPIVAITGQVIQPLIGRDAFQEVDITGITLPVTKHNYLVQTAADIAPTIKEAFHLAASGRPGPVLVDIPKSVFTANAPFYYPETVSRRGYQPTHTAEHAPGPAGGRGDQLRPRSRSSWPATASCSPAARSVFHQFVERTGMPVMFTLLGLGTFPEDHPLALGLMGMHGHKHVNDALDECDLLVNIGARFDDRATGRIDGFAPKAKVVHVDIDPAEIGKNVDHRRAGRRRCARGAAPAAPRGRGAPPRRVDGLDRFPAGPRARSGAGGPARVTPEPYTIIKAIAKATNGEAIVTTDVGQHQMWAAQHFGFNHPDRCITSGGLGTMGFGLPAAIGAKIGRPDLEVWAVVGDGGFQMSLNELATAVQENLDINIAVINNGYLGMVRQWQDLFHAKNYSEVQICAPDFVKLAEAYGMTGIRVTKDAEIVPAIEKARSIHGPVLIEFVIEPEANVWPIVPPGGSNSEMLHERFEG